MSRTKKKSGTRFFILQRQLCRRRLWMIAAVVLYMVMYYPVGTVMQIARVNERAELQKLTAAQLTAQRLGEVGYWTGLLQPFVWVAVVIAAVLAIQGYSFLFSMEKQDFYESQPVSRQERFWSIYANGFLIFEIPLVLGVLISVLCAAIMGGMDGLTFLNAVLSLLRQTLIFFASYSVGILAVMLTGNWIVSGILTAFLLLADTFFVDELRRYAQMFFRTFCYYGSGEERFLLSPLYNATAPERWISSQNSVLRYSQITAENLKKILSYCSLPDLMLLAVGAAALVLGTLLYKKRRMEDAGKTVLYRPVRTIVRILVSVGAGMFAGTIIINLFDSQTSRTGTVFMLVGIVFVTVLCAGIVQMIYELDIWKFFGKFWEIAVAAVLAAGIFSIYRYDLLGYDRYVPAADQVESAALYVWNDNNFYYPMKDNPEESVDLETHIMSDMKLTDINALLNITRPGMEAARTQNPEAGSQGWYGEVCYRMKNGRKIYRTILIPYDLDGETLDAVISGREYKENVLPVYSDTYVQEVSQQYGSLSFANGFGTLSAAGSLYTKFEEAYKKDLEQYSFTQMNRENSIGRVIFQTSRPVYIDQEYDVYPSYTNTIAFLRENGLYPEDAPADRLVSVTVSKYDDEGNSSSAEYTDPEQIREILEKAEMSISTNWKNTNELDYDYDISTIQRQTDVGTGYYYSLWFRKGEVPDFVLVDLEKNQIQEQG